MYILNDIVYAGEMTENIKVNEVMPLKNQMLLLTFSTGEKRLFDTTILKGSAFAPIKNKEIFNAVTVSHGVVVWNNGEIDCSPEYMYENSFKYRIAANDDILY